jgi:ell wall binding domain 2 (CWB2)
MRALPPRLLAVLALGGILSAGLLAGCGKGAGAQKGSAGSSTQLVGAPATSGVVGIATKNTTRLGGSDPASDAAAVAQAVYPGLTTATRPQAVVLVDEHDWPAALSASALAGVPLGAPLLYSDGDSLPAASAAALHAMRPIGATAFGGAQVIRIGTSAGLPDDLRARTIAPSSASADPAATAAAVEQLFQTAHGGSPRHVIVLSADAPRALQMPAAGLAAESGSPILLVGASGVPAATGAVLKRLHRPTIYVVGATAVSKRALDELARLGTVAHVRGQSGAGESLSAADTSDPVENAISVSRFARGSFGWGIHEAGHGLVFANLARALDAPAAAPLSAHGDYGPLLLLRNSASVPAALTQYLSDIEPGYTAAVPPVREVYNHGWLIGDEQAISALAQAELDTVLEIAPRKASPEEQSVVAAE